MRLLICTQAIDLDDPILGFFHSWVEKISKSSATTTVVCLFKGRNTLQSQIPILSLGKEMCTTTFRKIYLFFTYIIRARARYDAVFVHMNKEYVIMGFVLWKLMGKKIVFWYNHPIADWQARLAGMLADEIMYTSPQSYFGRVGKGLKMPVGVDVDVFVPSLNYESGEGQEIGYVGRVSPIKNIEIIIQAFEKCKAKLANVSLSIYGSTPDRDEHYLSNLKEKALKIGRIRFEGEIEYSHLPQVYNKCWCIVNMTDDGSFDKVIFEAMACGRLVISSNSINSEMIVQKYQTMLCPTKDSQELSKAFLAIFVLGESERNKIGQMLREIVVKHHSLDLLVRTLEEVSKK